MGTLLVRGLLAIALLLTFVFPAWAQDGKGIGVVTALTGRAGLKRPQAPETSLKLRDNLFVRDVVDTQKESLARILLMGKSTVTVRELSRFEIREETRPDGSQRALINLAEGRIRVMVARRLMRPGDEVEIRTPNAVAAVRGSDGVIEVSKLPDGRPQTVITGITGEFHLTLPTTPPFIANGKEFQDGPALAGGAPSVLIAMAETVSDAGSGLRLAQLPTGLNVTALVQAQVTGAAGAQIRTLVQLTLQQVLGIAGNYQLRAPSPPPPPAATDRVVNTGTALATTAALASGVQPGLGGGTALGSGGGGGGLIAQTPRTPVTNQPIMLTQVVDLRIPVLVYDQAGLATFLNGLRGSGLLFNATNVSSDVFSDSATWTASKINQFRVLVVGSTDGLTKGVAGLLANTNVGAAVNGNQVITGLHTEHILPTSSTLTPAQNSNRNQTQGAQFLINAIQWAAQSGAGKTGLFASTDGCNVSGCVGGSAGQTWKDNASSFLKNSPTNVFGSGTGQITVNRGVDQNSIVIANTTHPVNSGSGLVGGQPLNAATNLNGWTSSAHSTFTLPSSNTTGYQMIQTAGGQPVTLVK